MPMERSAESLKTFSLDILAEVHSVTNKLGMATQEEMHSVNSMQFAYSANTLSK
jgi:transportin-3